MVHDSFRAALSREVWLSICSPSGASVILGYACCPFCGNSVLVPPCDFIRHDPLRGNPALVPVCEFIRHACGPLCGNGALGAISFALPVALSAAILVRVSQCSFVCSACCILCGAAALVTQCDYWLRLLPFLWQFMLVPRCDFIRQDPLRVNPALVAPLRGGPALAPVCDFTRHACCPLGSIGALDAISFAALSAKILCGLAGPCFSCTASRGHSCRIFLGIPRCAGIPVSPALTWPFLFGCRLGLH